MAASQPEEKPVAIHDESILAHSAPHAIAQDLLAVDATAAKEIQQTLARSRQGGYAPVTAEEKAHHRALNRKFDLCLVPFCALIYLFNGLDRSNLGNAQTNGFTTDLHMSADAINTATSLFFATYVPLQPISAMVGKKVGQNYYLSGISICWGILTLGQAFIKTEAQLIAVRLLIGVFESGFYPTVVSYLSLFYPRYDLAFRIALFYGSYAIAGAFGGIIAYGCFHIGGGALYGWQYLFIIEGAVTIAVALATPFFLPKSPGSAWCLTAEQKAYAENRMVIDSAANLEATYKLSRKDIWEGVKDFKLWWVLPFNVLASVAPQGFTIFFPLVVKGLGYTGATANLMTVPPYVIGTVCLLLFAYSSDHFRERTLHILAALTLVIIGLILATTLPLSHTGARYAGLVILLAGTFISAPLTVAWLAGNTPEPGKRTVILGINGWGNLGGIIGSELFLNRYGPDYHWPLQVTLGLLAASWVGYASYYVLLRSVNRWKARKVAGMTPEEIEEENVGGKRYADWKWTFVYGL